MAGQRTRVAIVGVGDVAHRHYLPALRAMAERVEVAALVDTRAEAVAHAVDEVREWSPDARPCPSVAELHDVPAIDAAIDLTPAPYHGAVNRSLLEGGLHVYSEKPLASSLAEADGLIELAGERQLLLLCAPGSAVTTRIRWLADLIATGTYGRPTLAVAHHADPGPAAWRAYTGDPAPFYRDGVGPLFDHGVYRLHELTTLMGPVRLVQAMGSISSPSRRIRGGPRTGQVIDVTTPDHMLINLEFAAGGLGQLLASFGTPSTLAPWLELHFPMATISFGGQSWDPEASVRIYEDDDGPAAAECWRDLSELPADALGTVEAGVRHFIECVRGDAQPVLTAAHARHTLDITLKAYASIADGRAHATETTF